MTKIENLILKNGTILDLGTNELHRQNILIKNGKIEKITDESIEAAGVEVEDVTGQVIVPGLIDMHVHFREPGFEHKETIATGSQAAMAGGFTTVCTMPNTNPVQDSPEVIRQSYAKTAGQLVNVLPIASITKGRAGHELVDFKELVAAGAVGFSDDGGDVMNAQLMRQALEMAAELNVPIIEHCEDANLAAGGVMHEGEISRKLDLPGIPGAAEEVMVARNIILAELTGGKMHIAHISTARSVELVRRAKKDGLPVTCEVAPHHFTLTDEALLARNPNFKMNPPLRSQTDVNAILEGLADGTIDVIASDHAPHADAEKQQGLFKAPCGILGLETMLPLVITHLVDKNILSLTEAIKKMTIEPAKVLGLDYPEIRNGAEADLTIFNPQKEWQIDKNQSFSKSRNTPFHGWNVRGKVWGVYRNGLLWRSK